MSAIPRAAVLGHAFRTPLGGSVDAVVRRLLAGERAVRQNDRFPSDITSSKISRSREASG